MNLKAILCIPLSFNFTWPHYFLWNDCSRTETLLFEVFLLNFEKIFYNFLFMIILATFFLPWALLSFIFQLILYHFEFICIVDTLLYIQFLYLLKYTVFFLNFLLIWFLLFVYSILLQIERTLEIKLLLNFLEKSRTIISYKSRMNSCMVNILTFQVAWVDSRRINLLNIFLSILRVWFVNFTHTFVRTFNHWILIAQFILFVSFFLTSGKGFYYYFFLLNIHDGIFFFFFNFLILFFFVKFIRFI